VAADPLERKQANRDSISGSSRWTLIGFALTNLILLAYGLFRPESLDFSIPFLIAPSLAILGVILARDRAAKRAVIVTISGVIAGLVAVILVIELTR
jgi:hypothetical protein